MKIKILFVFDNSDICDVKVLKTIINIIRELLSNYPSVFILTMRDYIPNQDILGKDFQNIYPCISIPKNNLFEIIKKRITWAINYFNTNRFDCYNIKIIQQTHFKDKIINTINHKISPDAAKKMLERCINSLNYSADEHEIRKYLQDITDDNIREVIEIIYAFFHSSMLDLSPLFLDIYEENNNTDNYRIIDFRDVIDCCMAKHMRCYDVFSSPIINIFNYDDSKFDDDCINTLGQYLILKIIKNCGKIDSKILKNDLLNLNMAKNRIDGMINKMLKNNLISSTKHETPNIKHVTQYSITKKGKVYIDYLPFRFSYLYYVSDETPIDMRYCVSYEDREKNFLIEKRLLKIF